MGAACVRQCQKQFWTDIKQWVSGNCRARRSILFQYKLALKSCILVRIMVLLSLPVVKDKKFTRICTFGS